MNFQDSTTTPRDNGSHDEPFSTLLFIKGTEQKKLSLEDFRNDLIRQEETIIFALIERAQFKQNLITYKPGNESVLSLVLFISQYFNYLICDTNLGGVTENIGSLSFLDFFFSEIERVHSMMRRYTSPGNEISKAKSHPFIFVPSAVSNCFHERQTSTRSIPTSSCLQLFRS